MSSGMTCRPAFPLPPVKTILLPPEDIFGCSQVEYDDVDSNETGLQRDRDDGNAVGYS